MVSPAGPRLCTEAGATWEEEARIAAHSEALLGNRTDSSTRVGIPYSGYAAPSNLGVPEHSAPRETDAPFACLYYGMTRAEIARGTGRPVATVKTWLRRSLAELRVRLAQ